MTKAMERPEARGWREVSWAPEQVLCWKWFLLESCFENVVWCHENSQGFEISTSMMLGRYPNLSEPYSPNL